MSAPPGRARRSRVGRSRVHGACPRGGDHCKLPLRRLRSLSLATAGLVAVEPLMTFWKRQFAEDDRVARAGGPRPGRWQTENSSMRQDGERHGFARHDRDSQFVGTRHDSRRDSRGEAPHQVRVQGAASGDHEFGGLHVFVDEARHRLRDRSTGEFGGRGEEIDVSSAVPALKFVEQLIAIHLEAR